MDKHSIYLAKVLGESLPLPQDIREAKLKEKRNKVMEEKRTFIRFIDSIIEEGQEQGKFDSRIPASVIRQVFYGAIELILYGLFLKFLRNENIGYDLVDAKRALDKLIEKFLP
jgi:TetR/AcrR family fatty acid metabolism transcriptional regulator